MNINKYIRFTDTLLSNNKLRGFYDYGKCSQAVDLWTGFEVAEWNMVMNSWVANYQAF